MKIAEEVLFVHIDNILFYWFKQLENTLISILHTSMWDPTRIKAVKCCSINHNRLLSVVLIASACPGGLLGLQFEGL